MLYAVLVFWLVVAIFAAQAACGLLVRLLPAKIVNYLLLPGTVVAQIGHVVALLVTGATIRQTRLISRPEGEPELHAEARPKLPVIGPVLVAVLPMFCCGLGLYLVHKWLAVGLAINSRTSLPQDVPLSISEFWKSVGRLVDVLAAMSDSWLHARWSDWRTWLMAYLTVCLTIRIAPLPADVRPALAGLAIFGLLCGLFGMFSDWPEDLLRGSWPAVSFLVGNLLLLLTILLLVSALVGLYRILRGQSGSRGAGGE